VAGGCDPPEQADFGNAGAIWAYLDAEIDSGHLVLACVYHPEQSVLDAAPARHYAPVRPSSGSAAVELTSGFAALGLTLQRCDFAAALLQHDLVGLAPHACAAVPRRVGFPFVHLEHYDLYRDLAAYALPPALDPAQARQYKWQECHTTLHIRRTLQSLFSAFS
jgi:hypothetical protein